MTSVDKLSEFEWDKGNIGKNKKHDIKYIESEEAFLEVDKVVFRDALHSTAEERFVLLGKTKREKLLYIVFTISKNKIRIISARCVNRKEVVLYEKAD